MSATPEAWLRGPVEAIDPWLQPAAHALIQAREELPRFTAGLTLEQLWASPGGAASIGFHALHAAGALDRLLTYARGEALTPQQLEAAAAEKRLAGLSAELLAQRLDQAVTAALAQLAATGRESLLLPREVGRQKLPSSVLGLIFHAAEHTTRHLGQIATTAKVVTAGGHS